MCFQHFVCYFLKSNLIFLISSAATCLSLILIDFIFLLNNVLMYFFVLCKALEIVWQVLNKQSCLILSWKYFWGYFILIVDRREMTGNEYMQQRSSAKLQQGRLDYMTSVLNRLSTRTPRLHLLCFKIHIENRSKIPQITLFPLEIGWDILTAPTDFFHLFLRK